MGIYPMSSLAISQEDFESRIKHGIANCWICGIKLVIAVGLDQFMDINPTQQIYSDHLLSHKNDRKLI